MDRKRIEIDSFLQFRYVSDPRFSPDGAMAAFVVSQADVEKNGYTSDLWLLDVETKAVRQLTNRGDVRVYNWTSGNTVLFQSAPAKPREDCPTCYFEIDPRRGGEALEAFRLPMPVRSLQQLEDGRLLAVGVYDNREDPKNTAYEVIEETPFWFNGAGFIQGRRKGLFLYSRKNGDWTPITDLWTDVAYTDVRGSRLLYQAYPWKNWMNRPFEPELRLYDLTTGQERVLLEKHRLPNYRVALWKDTEALFVSTEDPVDGEGQASDFYALDLSGGEIRRLTEYGLGMGVNSICSDARYGAGQVARCWKDSFYFLVTLEEGACVCRLDADGTVTFRAAGEQKTDAVDSFDITEGHMLLSMMRQGTLAELFLDGEQVTHFNDAFAAEYDVLPAEFQSFKASDGHQIHGFAMKPAGFVPGKKYPTILHIHGGPLGAFGWVYHHEMQMWANAGYMVIYCNPRGSDGRGRDHSVIFRQWGSVDYQNIMDFTDEMIRRYPEIDETKMAVCGGSYGGFMTNWVIGHTNRFAAACAQRSISFMSGFEYSSDIGLMCMETEQGATTETDYQELWRQSPLKYAPNCTTPTLFIQSDEDYRCYMTDAMAMFNSLKMHGCPAKMCLFHGENHELSRSGRPKNRISRMEEIVKWFDRYLKG